MVERNKSQKPRSSGGDLILAIDLQGVGVAPQLYNEGLTPSLGEFLSCYCYDAEITPYSPLIFSQASLAIVMFLP